MDKFDILGLKMTVGNYNEVVDLVIKKAKQGKKLTVAPLSIHPAVLASFDKDYRKILNSLDLVIPDSYWHLWGINFLYKTRYKERFYGPFFMRDLIKRVKKERLNIYLFGGKSKRTFEKLEKWFKKLAEGKGKIYTYEASFSIDDNELDDLVKKIKKEGKGMLFVGVGTPLQHKILSRIKDSLKIPVIAVGAAFNLLSGEEKMAPDSWRKSGLEWLFRLKENPVRLLGRYLFCLLFFPLILGQKLKYLFDVAYR